MIWLYWRRLRLAVLAVGLTLGSASALVIASGSLAGTGQGPAAARRAGPSRTGAQLRRPAPAPVDPHLARRGLLLMNAAVVACQTVSYHGVQMVAWWGPDGSSAYLIQVWHRPGQPELAEGDGDAPAGSGQKISPVSSGPGTAGVLSVPSWMLTLLRANYVIEYAGTGTANDRPALIVSVRRKDGTLTAKYWLDQATGLPVRREMFDSLGHLVNEGAFVDLTVGNADVDPEPAARAQAWSAQPSRTGLNVLRRQGWPVPRSLAGDMALVSVARASTRSGSVLDASYSDGLSVVSVFMQRGELPKSLPGWQQAVVRGQPVYSSEPDERSIAWSAPGFVYTVISDAPQGTVARVVAELPHNSDTGLWQRVGRGLKRIGSWFNPFG